MTKPKFLTFDIFGTVLDWYRGLEEVLASLGRPLHSKDFDRIIDYQGRLETEAFKPYTEIVSRSLVEVLQLSNQSSSKIAKDVGTWPLFNDSKKALGRIMEIAPCVALTNSDRAHGEQVQNQLGFKLSGWQCAEDIKCYKPSRQVWIEAAKTFKISPDRNWWHVSAYADYDLGVAKELGLTCIFIERDHKREGFSHLKFPTLNALADFLPKLGN